MNQRIGDGNKLQLSIDPQFVKRVYRTTLWVAAIILLVLLSIGKWKTTVGFLAGTSLALALLKSHELLAPRIFTVSEERKKKARSLVGLTLLKYVVLGVILWALFAHEWVNPLAVFAGFVLVQAVIFLKVVGLLVCAKMGIRQAK